MVSFIMIGKINERVPESERISYFWWGTEVRKRYKQLYPASKLALTGGFLLNPDGPLFPALDQVLGIREPFRWQVMELGDELGTDGTFSHILSHKTRLART